MLLGPLDEPALREVIVRPAQEVGALFEKGLVSIILRDVAAEAGALPLLEQALYELWRARRGPWLTQDAYDASGGVAGALNRRADLVYTNLTAEQQAIARKLLERLITLGEGVEDTRQRTSRKALYLSGVDSTQVDAVLQTLSGPDARLVVADGDTVEVAHEALIQRWNTLRTWLDEDRAALRVQRRLTEAAKEWDENKRDESYLFEGARLAEAEEWAAIHTGDLNPQEREFLDASLALRDREAAEREAARQRELETAQKLTAEAEARRKAETQRADDQARSAQNLRRRNQWLAAALAVALLAGILAIWFGLQSSQNEAVAKAAQIQAQEQKATAVANAELADTRAAEAKAAQGRAETEARHAGSGDLVALAVFQVDSDPELGIRSGAGGNLHDADSASRDCTAHCAGCIICHYCISCPASSACRCLQPGG